MPILIHPVAPEELMAYLDGELEGAEAARVREHAASCLECQALAAEFSGVSQSLQEWTPVADEMGAGRRWKAAMLAKGRRGGILSHWTNGVRWVSQHRWLVSGGLAALVVAAVFVSPREVKEERRAAVAKTSELNKVESYAFMQRAPDLIGGNGGEGLLYRASAPARPPAPAVRTPQVIRTAGLTIVTGDYARTRARLDEAIAAAGGFTAHLDENNVADSGRTLNASLRVPATALDATLIKLKALGRVENESQSGEEVTEKIVNVEARLSNLRAAEVRLTEILRQRTGKLSDVLEVEEHLTSVRGQIETAEAEQKLLATQVALSRIDVRVNEEVRRSLNPAREKDGWAPVGLRLWNALVEGLQNLRETAVTIAAGLLQAGPVLLVIAAILFVPVRRALRRKEPA